MAKALRGIFPILATPYDEDMTVDEEDLRRLVNYLIEQGAHGLAANGESSECHRLSCEERMRTTEWVLEETHRRVSVIVGVSAAGTAESVRLAHHASVRGADGVFSTAPIGGEPTPDSIYAHFKAIDEAVDIPVTVQERTVSVPSGLIVRMAEELEHVRYVKEERPKNVGQKIAEILSLSDQVQVFSGGMNIIEELQRGAIGTIPGSVGVAGYVRIFDSYMEGNLKAAWSEYERILPLISFRRQINHILLTKEVLRRQGVFKSIRVREPVGLSLDAVEMQVLSQIMGQMGPPF